MHELLERFKHDTRLPTIKGEQCVHALMENASCRGCAEVCPKDAWLLDDDSLSLDVDACDGCGLCVPVCPEGAISIHGYSIALRQAGNDIQQQLNAFCACEYVAQEAEGIVPCIHALKLQDILRLVNKGVGQLTLATGDCCECERAGKNDFFELVSKLNKALQSNNDFEISVKLHSPNEWRRLLNQESTAASGPDINRRNFFRALVSNGIERKLDVPDLLVLDESEFVPAGQLMPGDLEFAVWPVMPVLDMALCNGCDACLRLCPHEAMVLQELEDESSYKILPKNCTGCNICVDVCETSAITLSRWQAGQSVKIPLEENQCRACGNAFHIPRGTNALEESRLCRICSQHNHYKNLHQVLSD